MQHATSGSRPVLILPGADVGHGGRSLNKSIEEFTSMLAFMARWTGLELS
jgi:prolyl oligopeptidase